MDPKEVLAVVIDEGTNHAFTRAFCLNIADNQIAALSAAGMTICGEQVACLRCSGHGDYIAMGSGFPQVQKCADCRGTGRLFVPVLSDPQPER